MRHDGIQTVALGEQGIAGEDGARDGCRKQSGQQRWSVHRFSNNGSMPARSLQAHEMPPTAIGSAGLRAARRPGDVPLAIRAAPAGTPPEPASAGCRARLRTAWLQAAPLRVPGCGRGCAGYGGADAGGCGHGWPPGRRRRRCPAVGWWLTSRLAAAGCSNNRHSFGTGAWTVRLAADGGDGPLIFGRIPA